MEVIRRSSSRRSGQAASAAATFLPSRIGRAYARGLGERRARWPARGGADFARSSVKILPVIMCGGAGTRVWPESRETLPKQFIPLVGARSTFQMANAMLADPVFETPLVISNFDYRFHIVDQLEQIDAKADIVLQPMRA